MQAVGALALTAALPGCGRPEPLLRVATNRWAGYQFIHLAQDLGLYDPLRVRAIEMPNATDTLRALTAGTVEGAGLTLDELISVRADGLDLVAVLVFDESAGADALMAQAEVQTLADLRGRRVGLEASPVAGLLLDAALRVAGLAPDDVQRVYLPATEHLLAWQKNKVQAIVSYEPYVQEMSAQGGLRLFDSREMPGAILDVLAVHRRVLHSNPQGLRQLVSGHFAAMHRYREQRAAVEPLLGARLGLPPVQLAASFSTLKLPDVATNRAWLGGAQPLLPSSTMSLERSMRASGLLRAPVPLEGLSSDIGLPAANAPEARS
jgi:NitT/TauT family transport system substrate-binding protein